MFSLQSLQGLSLEGLEEHSVPQTADFKEPGRRRQGYSAPGLHKASLNRGERRGEQGCWWSLRVERKEP